MSKDALSLKFWLPLNRLPARVNMMAVGSIDQRVLRMNFSVREEGGWSLSGSAMYFLR